MNLQHFAAVNFDEIGLGDLDPGAMPPYTEVFGSPTMQMAVLFGDGEGAGTVAAWTCDQDGFSYKDLPSPETAFIVDGSLRLTHENGTTKEVRAGEGYLLSAGWSGTVEVVEPVRKIFILLWDQRTWSFKGRSGVARVRAGPSKSGPMPGKGRWECRARHGSPR
ncbi:cupin domain-containing protein [Arthrobacter sp. GCM10027362]|uniref:cupin domain-containing protein n=1 Tax=Arthrobacter sp. GCM10027362 TaxID=3273379 RepID=UPI003627FC5D